jgi:predicted  nucleic acid-binding Zn-ribbon protein
MGMTLEEEVAHLRAEDAQLKEQLSLALEQLAQALARIAELEVKLEQVASGAPTFVKPSTPKKEKSEKQPRRPRAKDQNGARRREQTPTQTIEHKVEQCPDCGYTLRQHQVSTNWRVDAR